MNKDAITIEGRWDRGAWDRAIMVARELQRVGLWDGEEALTIIDPYAVHGRLFGIEHCPAAALTAGSEYRIGAGLRCCPSCGANLTVTPPSDGYSPYCMVCGADLELAAIERREVRR